MKKSLHQKRHVSGVLPFKATRDKLALWIVLRSHVLEDYYSIKGRFKITLTPQEGAMEVEIVYLGKKSGNLPYRFQKMRTLIEARIAQDLDLLGTPIPKKVLITGASGLVGRSITSLLTFLGSEVLTLSLQKGEGVTQAHEQIDLVIHLAGENIGAHRWSAHYKKRFYESRVDGTLKLGALLSTLKYPPKAWVSVSAIVKKEGFLQDLAKKWEEASKTAAALCKAKCLIARLSTVLSFNGGALPKIILPFAYQIPLWIGKKDLLKSYISLDDLIYALIFLWQKGKEGVFCFTMPEPVKDERLALILARAFGMNHFYAMPKLLARILLGQIADELLYAPNSETPDRLIKENYNFKNPKIELLINSRII